jgi:hypothetical protein
MSNPPGPCTARSTNQLLAEFLVPEIAGNGQTDPPLGLDQLDDFLRVGLLRGEIIDRDIGAFPREGDGRRAAHAGVAAGD